MCEKVVGADRLELLKDVPDWLVSQQQLQLWRIKDIKDIKNTRSKKPQ